MLGISKPQTTFEIYVTSDHVRKRDKVFKDEASAVARAVTILNADKKELRFKKKLNVVQIVRIERDKNKGGASRSKVVFEEYGEREEKKEDTIIHTEESADCARALDFYNLEARLTIGRVLRPFLEKMGMTPLELLYSYGRIKQLQRTRRLYKDAVSRIATIQVRKTGKDSFDRIDELYKLINSLLEMTKKTVELKSFSELLQSEGLRAVIGQARASLPENMQDYAIRYALADKTGETREWTGKITRLAALANTPLTDEAYYFLDECFAEILDNHEAIKAVAGGRPDLISSLRVIAQMRLGVYEEQRGDISSLLRMNKMMATGKMYKTSEILLKTLIRIISGISPLTKKDQETATMMFINLVEDLVVTEGVCGGGEMAEALTQRARMVMNADFEKQTVERAVRFLASKISADVRKISYLMDLSCTDLGEQYQISIAREITEIISEWRYLSDLETDTLDKEKVIRYLEHCYDKLSLSNLNKERKKELSKIFNDLIHERKISIEFNAKPKIEDSDKEEKVKNKDASSSAPAGRMEAAVKEKEDVVSKATVKREFEKTKGVEGFKNKEIYKWEYIFHEGESGTEAYLIISGKVEILKNGDFCQVPIGTLGKGELFGEMAVIDNRPRMASAKALEDTVLMVVPRKEIQSRVLRLKKEDPVMKRLLDVFIARIRSHEIREFNKI